ncbi:ABC transporter substrate-binding protein [Xanthobacter dioxanivorans]|uniref:ABC transporter substrate-binding protein n=1 Tax=Xanthobacter dioxanivorans TaxID=2528964 RepID=A0A974PS32_9HYPH|nr:ABC transporter substrate-binding protein [Xanthobacter dioxanivorans]QRG08421.1 ABC transporter substrate-binding protein [Xanthobacter dioxanivorans]
MKRLAKLAASALVLAAALGPHLARAAEVRVVSGLGLCYLPMIVAAENKLIEKHAAALGMPDVKVTYTQLTSGPAITDALISGNADIAMAGTSVMLNLWDKTVKFAPVKGMMAICDSPIYFNTIDPDIRSIKDFKPTDRIAMAAGKGTQHALILEMATAQAYGFDQRNRFDTLAITMSHPDGVAALLSGGAGAKTHVTTVPFIQMELANPNVRTILSSYDVTGGPNTLITAYANEKWRAENPKLYAATYAALTEAMTRIAADRTAAAQAFKRFDNSRLSVAEIVAILNDPNMMTFSPTPHKVMVFAQYMNKTGLLKTLPGSWKDVFFSNVHDLPGD